MEIIALVVAIDKQKMLSAKAHCVLDVFKHHVLIMVQFLVGHLRSAYYAVGKGIVEGIVAVIGRNTSHKLVVGITRGSTAPG